MSRTLLEQLREMTTVVADTGDINAIHKVKPQDATTNPSLITAAAQMKQYRPIVDEVLLRPRRTPANRQRQGCREPGYRAPRRGVRQAHLGDRPGPRLDRGRRAPFLRHEATHRQGPPAHRAVRARRDSRERVLIKIASTWEGIKAAEVLEKEGIHCNLTLLFGLHQAIACAEAKVTLISPFVGRILDWYKKDTGEGVPRARRIPASCRSPRSTSTSRNSVTRPRSWARASATSARSPSWPDAISSPSRRNFLEELEAKTGDLPRKLDPAKAKAGGVERIPMDEATFRKMHAADKMASDKLEEGIQGFSEALVNLEKLLATRLAELGASKETVGAH